MGDAYTKEAYKIIYQHPDWQSTAQEYEDKFAANLYRTSYVQQAAATALSKLSQTLTGYYQVKRGLNGEQAQDLTALGEVAEQVGGRSPDDWRVLEGALLQRNSGSGAGQIGRWQEGDEAGEQEAERLGVDAGAFLFQRDADQLNRENIQNVLEDGNLREQMTMLYNGMFLNGGKTKEEIAESRSLKNLLLNITEADEEQMRAGGMESKIRFDLLREMGHYGKGEDLFDTYSMARDLRRGQDYLKHRGNALTRWASGIKRAFRAAFSSKFSRSNKKKEEQTGLGKEHYERLGLGLSEREMANGLDAEGNLKWKEGQAYFRMDTPVTAEGMLQTAGPSGTTLRMLGAYRLLGASKNDLLFFRLALIAWMVSSRDHSLYEILKGSHNAGVKGSEDLSEAANMYRTIAPLEESLIRQTLAPNARFPHETVYLKIMNAYLQKYSGESMVEDENAEDIFAGIGAYDTAVGVYSGELYSVMNTGGKYGDYASRLAAWKLSKKEVLEEDEEERKMQRRARAAVGEMGFDVAKLSARILQEGMEERGSRDTGEGEMTDTYDRWGRGVRFLGSDHAFRGTTYRGGKLTSAMRKRGNIVTDSFLSTSMAPNIAMDFYEKSGEGEKDKALFRFRLDGKGSVNITEQSMVEDEMEVLIPQGTTLQVLGEPRPVYYKKHTQEIREPDQLSEYELEDIQQDQLRGENGNWIRCQLVELQEIGGPGEKRRQRMAQKQEKHRVERERLSAMREEAVRRRQA